MLTMLVAMTLGQLRCDRPLVELGEVLGARERLVSVSLHNSTQQPAMLTSIERSCGCVAPRFEARTLRPGESTSLEMAVRPFGQPDGPHSWFVTLHYSLADQKFTLPMQIKATVRNEVMVTPSSLALFGKSGLKHTIRVTDRRAKSLTIVDARSTISGLVVSAQDGRLVEVTVRDLTPGRHEGAIVLTTDDPVYPQFTIPIVARIDGGNPFSPETARFESGVASMLVRVRDGTIEKATPSQDGITCTWANGDAGGVLRVRVDREKMINRRTAIEVRFTDGKSAKLEVEIEN